MRFWFIFTHWHGLEDPTIKVFFPMYLHSCIFIKRQKCDIKFESATLELFKLHFYSELLSTWFEKSDDLTRFWPPCRILTEERHRYCNLVASLKPIIDEELGMLSELASVEDVMQKLGNVTSNPDEVCKLTLHFI